MKDRTCQGEGPGLPLDWGRCCRGVKSTYNIRVGRSREITGPYLDNVRQDGRDFLAEARSLPVRTRVEAFPLESANEALLALKDGAIRGSGVLVTEAGGG